MSAPADQPPVLLLYGDEALRVREAEQAAVQQALDGDSSGFNLATCQAEEPGAILELARTAPMMAARRVIVVRDLEKAAVDFQDALLDYVDRPCPSTVLVLTGRKLPEARGGVNRGVRLRNRVAKVGRVERFQASKEDPIAFAEQRARALGCRLGRGAAELLVELAGRDLGRLAMELDKASSWLGGEGLIDVAVVEQTCSVVGEAEIWALTAALVERDPDAALAATHRLLSDGAAAHYLLAMVSWQFRQLLVLQDCQRRGIDPKAAGLRMRWDTRKQAERSLRARPLSEAELMGRLARANRMLNWSRAGDARVFEGIVLELATR